MLDRVRSIDRVLEWPFVLRLGACAVALLLPMGLAFQFLVKPRMDAVATAREEVAAKQKELDDASQRAMMYAQIAREAPLRKTFIKRFDTWVPGSERLPEALSAAALAARTSGVLDLTFDRETRAIDPSSTAGPKATADGEEVPESPFLESLIRIEARASLPAVAVFVDTLLSSPRYLRLDEVKVAPLPIERAARISMADPARLGVIVRVTTFSQKGQGS